MDIDLDIFSLASILLEIDSQGVIFSEVVGNLVTAMFFKAGPDWRGQLFKINSEIYLHFFSIVYQQRDIIKKIQNSVRLIIIVWDPFYYLR